MSMPDNAAWLEEQIEQWRGYLRRRPAIQPGEVEIREGQLRERVAGLVTAGLATDEAFLVAVKRMGDLDAVSREFAREHSTRLWKQLVVVRPDSGESRKLARQDAVVAFCLAVAAALLVKLPILFGLPVVDQNEGIYFRNVSFFVLPLLAGYFSWKRQLGFGTVRWLVAAFLVAGGLVNLYPFVSRGSTEALAALHLPIALWLVIGVAHAGGQWVQTDGRMDFIRFSGELVIYYALIAAGGGVFMGFMAVIFQAIGINAEPYLEWIVPSGAAGAVLIASRLVEAKQGVIDNLAPVLTRLFTPLFVALLLAFLGTVLWTGRGIDIQRNVLIAFDLLLLVVLGLLLYSISSRDPRSPPGVFDGLQVVLVISALLANGLALWAIAARISEFGFTPNRVAALGENVLLLVNLAWSVVLYARFLRGRGSFAALEKWQTGYLTVYSAWAAAVVILFPPLFGFV
jgi:hypothetical protein